MLHLSSLSFPANNIDAFQTLLEAEGINLVSQNETLEYIDIWLEHNNNHNSLILAKNKEKPIFKGNIQYISEEYSVEIGEFMSKLHKVFEEEFEPEIDP